MHKKAIKRKIYSYFSKNKTKYEKETLKEDLTIFLEKILVKKGETLIELIVIIILLITITLYYYFNK